MQVFSAAFIRTRLDQTIGDRRDNHINWECATSCSDLFQPDQGIFEVDTLGP